SLPVFVVLAIRQDDGHHFDALTSERIRELGEVQRCDRCIAHHRDSGLSKMGADQFGLFDKAQADMDGIAALAERYADSLHSSGSSNRSSRIRETTLWRPVSRTRSAVAR